MTIVFVNASGVTRTVTVADEPTADKIMLQKIYGKPGERLKEIIRT